ncbi:MAG: hypothetical protein ONB11_03270 [candidate division KSB1 bacterium]|nr:hypothetical protein [candidate division KSB1 bacterium]MDZ7341807.1 hypothetical protein [candidate division KSB1 bacterium]
MGHFILNNFKIKAVAFFMAVLLWLFVKTEDNYTYSIDIPLQISNQDQNRVIESELPKTIKVTAWGKGRDLLSLRIRNDIFYNLDVSAIQHSAKIALQRNQIKFRHGNNIDILNIVDPESLQVITAELLTKKVPVIADVTVQTVPGYTVVDELKLTPDSVVIQGRKSALSHIESISTAKRLFKEVRRDLKKTVPLALPAEKGIRLHHSEVTLFADVQKLMEKPITEIPVQVINQPPGLKITVIPSTLSLVLEGGVDLLLNVTKADVRAYLDYRKIQSSQEKSHLAYIETPPGTRYRDVKPKRFSILVEKLR